MAENNAINYTQQSFPHLIGGHIRCMHARSHCRKDLLPLRSLRDFRSRLVFTPVRPRLARSEHKRPQWAAGH